MIDLIKEEDHHKILVVVAIGGCRVQCLCSHRHQETATCPKLLVKRKEHTNTLVIIDILIYM